VAAPLSSRVAVIDPNGAGKSVSGAFWGGGRRRRVDLNVAARLSSRVAVIGPNGAGKSVSEGVGGWLSQEGCVWWWGGGA
jgi:ABC-type branched-subunit amino acid transport system ATPase component